MNPDASLAEVVWAVVHEALELYRDSPRATNWLRRQLRRFEEPLRIAVTGSAQAGKSTLVNALVGEEIAPIEVADGKVPVWYRDGTAPTATVLPLRGSGHERTTYRLEKRLDERLQVDLSQWRSRQVSRVVVNWPARTLRYSTFIDAPALGQVRGDADAVLYLVTNMDSPELELLEAAQDNIVDRATPVNAILVLSRADEIGASRVDALTAATLIARRYRRDADVWRRCQNIVAVAGLTAQAGRTLRQSEFAALAALASVPRPDLDPLLLSADRFVGPEFPAPLEPEARRALLDRFGIFGVRLATTLVRTGCGTPSTLSAELVRRSGLRELRESISRLFLDRSDVLKARSALLALDVVLRTEPRPGADQLHAALERALVSAHDLRELRLLAALRAGRTKLPPDLTREAEHLLGGHGTSLPARLGIDHETGEAELWSACSDALDRWQEQAENPALGHVQRLAAQTVVRSCEGMLEQLR